MELQDGVNRPGVCFASLYASDEGKTEIFPVDGLTTTLDSKREPGRERRKFRWKFWKSANCDGRSLFASVARLLRGHSPTITLVRSEHSLSSTHLFPDLGATHVIGQVDVVRESGVTRRFCHTRTPHFLLRISPTLPIPLIFPAPRRR